MLIHVAEERSALVDLVLASILSFVAGMVNTAGLHIVGFFSANMTGNVSLVAENGYEGRWSIALVLGGIVLFFILGAFSATIVSGAPFRRSRETFPRLVIIEAAIIAVAGASATLGFGSDSVVGLMLAFAMGLQNATTTLISGARVRTTHVSGMATDLGIEAAMMIRGPERVAVAGRFRLHGTTILAFLAGSFVSAVVHFAQPGTAISLAPPTALLFVTGMMEWLRARRLSVTSGADS